MSDIKTSVPTVSKFINENQVALFGDESTIKQIITRGSKEDIGQLQTITDAHLKEMAENSLEIARATNIFGRSQSDYMNYQFTVSSLFPHRNAQQLLAELESRRSALSENVFKQKAQIVEGKEMEERLKNMVDEYEKLSAYLSTLSEADYTESIGEYVSKEKKRNINYKKRLDKLEYDIPKLQVEIEKIQSQLADSRVYIEGALRTIIKHERMYNSIVKTYGIENWTEEDYENAEAEYHVATAFSQAMEDFYARGGVIDKGDLIYMKQIGIHPAVAVKELQDHQKLIVNHMLADQRIGAENPYTQEMVDFLLAMAKKYAPAHKSLLAIKGMDKVDFSDLMVK